MNIIQKIAEMLGVEIGEEFEVTGYGGTYSFKENGMYYYDKPRKEWTLVEDYVFVDILRGIEEIKKLPFEPKENEEYWSVIFSPFSINRKELSVNRYIWQENYSCHYELKYCGNCFRTEAEAEKHKYEIYEKLTGKKWEEKCED